MGLEAKTRAGVRQAVFGVSDMENSLRFYVDGLGFEMTRKWMDGGTVRWCWLQRGGAGLMLQDFRREDGTSWSPDGKLGLGVSNGMWVGHVPARSRRLPRRVRELH